MLLRLLFYLKIRIINISFRIGHDSEKKHKYQTGKVFLISDSPQI